MYKRAVLRGEEKGVLRFFLRQYQGDKHIFFRAFQEGLIKRAEV